VLLAALGLIMTPVYLLSMLREIFYGKENTFLEDKKITWSDAQPREIFITACLLIPIIGIGLYPKLATQTYDVKTTQVAIHEHQALANVSRTTDLYASIKPKSAPEIKPSETLGMISINELDKILLFNLG
ncbi:MAG: NAD(P)H-quinone oxidoreductase subunit 4, partial [Waterburya sp.]